MKAEISKVWDNPKDHWRATVKIEGQVVCECHSMVGESEVRQKAGLIVDSVNAHAALSERVRELQEALFKATKSMEQAETSLRVIEGRDRGTQDDDTVRELFSSSATEAGDAAQDIGNSIYEARQTLAAQRSEP